MLGLYIKHKKKGSYGILSLGFPYQIETCHLQFSALMELPWEGQLQPFVTRSI